MSKYEYPTGQANGKTIHRFTVGVIPSSLRHIKFHSSACRRARQWQYRINHTHFKWLIILKSTGSHSIVDTMNVQKTLRQTSSVVWGRYYSFLARDENRTRWHKCKRKLIAVAPPVRCLASIIWVIFHFSSSLHWWKQFRVESGWQHKK